MKSKHSKYDLLLFGDISLSLLFMLYYVLPHNIIFRTNHQNQTLPSRIFFMDFYITINFISFCNYTLPHDGDESENIKRTLT